MNRLQKIEMVRPVYFKDNTKNFNAWVYRGLHDNILDGWIQLGEYLHSIDAEPEEDITGMWIFNENVSEAEAREIQRRILNGEPISNVVVEYVELKGDGLTRDEFQKEYLGSWNEKED